MKAMYLSKPSTTYAKENGIINLSFPPHTSHRLQPLDVGVFGPFKRKLKIALNNWHIMNPGKALTIYNTPKLVNIALFESFTTKRRVRRGRRTSPQRTKVPPTLHIGAPFLGQIRTYS